MDLANLMENWLAGLAARYKNSKLNTLKVSLNMPQDENIFDMMLKPVFRSFGVDLVFQLA
jgi:hypothetical protein